MFRAMGLARSASYADGGRKRPTSPAARNKRFVQCVRHSSAHFGLSRSLPKERPQSAMPKKSAPMEADMPKHRRPMSALATSPVNTLAQTVGCTAELEVDDLLELPVLEEALSGMKAGRLSGMTLSGTLRPQSAHRMWSRMEEEMLAALDSNCQLLRKKSSEQLHMNYAADSMPPTPLSPALPRKKRMSAQLSIGARKLLSSKSFNNKDPDFESKPKDEAIRILQEMQAQDPVRAKEIGGIIGEYQAGVCRVLFSPTGEVKRQVIIHAIRITRNDDCELMQLGRWAPRVGFQPMCGYPGAKRPNFKDFDRFIDSLVRDLEPMLRSGLLQREDSDSKEWTEVSGKYRTPTTYIRLLQLATFVPPEGEGKSSSKAKVKEFTAKESPDMEPSKKVSFDIIDQLRNVTVVLDTSLPEAYVYAWVPGKLAARVVDDKASKDALRDWVGGFSEEVTAWCSAECEEG